jgi:tRNA-specific 2-thiouridylase
MVKKLGEKTVFVGISGGVDSAVAALLLKQQGYKVVGVFIRTWTPDFINCTWKSERRDAMRVCANLSIPFLECDAEKEYKEGVANYMIEEYKKGRTPNPDVMCNREVKFGVFWNFAKKKGADFIATGHYVKNRKENKLYNLLKNKDEGKDQVYFLWTLTQEDLSHSLFPLGDLNKKEVRKIALKNNLPNAKKKDSQGVCFLGPLDMKKFLEHYIETKEGDVLNEENEIIGTHRGSIFFTIGERHGFNILKKFKKSKPLYVIKKDIKNNTITVSENSPISPGQDSKSMIIKCQNVNWINNIPLESKRYQAQIRYHGELVNCRIKNEKQDSVSVIFENSVNVDAGQSIVFYDKDVCLGGGVVN